jgi:GMP synthase (glutamine-hydrolysing)
MTPKSTAGFEKIVIIDLGSQYTQLIARRIRELGVFSEIHANTLTAADIKKIAPVGIILSGGPNSVYQYGSPQIDPGVFSLGIPVLGICYGMQLIARVFKERVVTTVRQEFGKTDLEVDKTDSALFAGLNPTLVCWMSHGDILERAPAGFAATSHTTNTPVASFESVDRGIYGVQFHPEVTHTPWGMELLHNFLVKICKAKCTWKMSSYIDIAVGTIRKTVAKDGVICALSGGVDSISTAAIVHRAVGRQLVCVFVDHGLLREGEGDQVEQAFNAYFKSPLIRINAQARFLSKLKDVTDPEKKRMIIGMEFINVFEEEARKHRGVRFLAQGTLYPDVIESRGIGLHASKIKSHHNVGGLPEKMKLTLVEPLRDLFKDEVRRLALELGLPQPVVNRQPFPGPGLAIRVVGKITERKLAILRRADAIIDEEIRSAGLYEETWQAFAVLPSVKSVGVMGDHRTYGYPIVLRAVTSNDGMTADWARLPYRTLERISSRIINEVPGVNRVVYDVSSKPPSTIEWE